MIPWHNVILSFINPQVLVVDHCVLLVNSPYEGSKSGHGGWWQGRGGHGGQNKPKCHLLWQVYTPQRYMLLSLSISPSHISSTTYVTESNRGSTIAVPSYEYS